MLAQISQKAGIRTQKLGRSDEPDAARRARDKDVLVFQPE